MGTDWQQSSSQANCKSIFAVLLIAHLPYRLIIDSSLAGPVTSCETRGGVRIDAMNLPAQSAGVSRAYSVQLID
jgi:hypothetical protein